MSLHKIWTPISSIEELIKIEELSITKKVAIFKHSTRCGISKMVLRQFEKQIESETNIAFFYLDLLEYRAISNEISARYSVEHQSPQLLVIEHKSVVAHASHNQILDLNVS